MKRKETAINHTTIGIRPSDKAIFDKLLVALSKRLGIKITSLEMLGLLVRGTTVGELVKKLIKEVDLDE